MNTKTCLGGGMALLAAMAANGAEFPLAFKTVPADQAWTLPGGSGGYAQLRTRKPSEIKSEPKAVSPHPIYGTFSRGDNDKPIAFRLDESEGKGKGYDTLLVDLNGNGDLNDDKPIAAIKSANSGRSLPQERDFGPIPAPDSLRVGSWQPIDYAKLLLYNPTAVDQDNQNLFLGYLRMQSGCYLETTVTLEGQTEKLAFFDGNANLRLGDRPRMIKARSGDSEFIYFTEGDAVLRDRDGSGKFEASQFGSEAEPMGVLLYVGAKPYTVKFAPDYAKVSLEPLPDALGEIAIEPKGEFVSTATLAQEIKRDEWELLAPSYSGGKAQVPAGRYRLYQTVLSGKNAEGDAVTAAAYNRSSKGVVEVAAGQTTKLQCGAPLTLAVTASKRSASGNPGGVMGAALSLFGGKSDKNSGAELAINMAVTGSGGETYSGYLKGKDAQVPPPQPRFKVLTADGKQVASGNLEYG